MGYYALGASGASYDLEPASFGSEFPDLPGIYLVAEPSRGLRGGLTAVYVGRARNLNERVGKGLHRHHRFLEIWRPSHSIFYYLELPLGPSRRYVELDLYESLRPRLNKIRPDGPVNALSLFGSGPAGIGNIFGLPR